MKSNKALFGGALLAAGVAGSANAQITLYDVDRDPSGWDNAVRGKIMCDTSTDLDRDADYGIIGYPGPVTSAGNGAGGVGAGTVADWMSLDTVLSGNYYGNMVGVGPSAGFGTTANAIGANYFVDSLQIDMVGNADKCAFQFSTSTLLGSYTVDITVIETDGTATTFRGVSASNNTYGIAGGNIAQVILNDGAGGGAEFIQGQAFAWVVPAPGALALLGLGGLAAARRRR